MCKRELTNLIRAKYPIIAVTTQEESRITAIIGNIGKSLNMKTRVWTLTNGFSNLNGANQENAPDPQAAILTAQNFSTRALFILKDFHPYIASNNPANVPVIRQLKDCAELLKNSSIDKAKCIILLCPSLDLPEELKTIVSMLDWPLPSESEIKKSLEELLNSLPANKKEGVDIQDLVKAAKGLTLDEFENCLAKSLISTGIIDKKVILEEKKKSIKKDGLLEIMESEGGLETVGGLENLKAWLALRKKAFKEEAKAYGLPFPKGLCLVGMPGAGKSLCAKAASLAWEMPILKLDIGKLFGALLGESEANLRKALKITESIGSCILFIDEIDKGLGGTDASNGSTDGGTSSRILQGLLTWLQEKKSEVFVFVTANRIEGLPPELLRRGRFDDIFFVDLPNSVERKAIWNIHISKKNRKPENFNVDLFTFNTEGFSGSEIESCFVDAMFKAYSEDREVNNEDVLEAISTCVPLSKMAPENLNRMREWSKGKAKSASITETATVTNRFSNLQ